MQINTVLNKLSDPTSWGKKGDSLPPAAQSVVKTASAATQLSPAASKAAVSILRKYDITNISADDFSQMVTQLHQAGALSDKDVQDLSNVRTDLAAAGISPTQSVNLVDFYASKVQQDQKSIQSNGENGVVNQQQLGADKHQLDWMQKFATIQEHPDTIGVDMAA
jgi:hypothetical protein